MYGTLSPVEVLLEIIDGRFGGFENHNGEENNPNVLNRYEPRVSSIQPVTTSIYLSYFSLLDSNVSYKYTRMKVLSPKTEEKCG